MPSRHPTLGPTTPQYNSASYLAQNLPNRLPAIGDGTGATAVVENGQIGIDAQAFIDRGADVGGADRLILDKRRLGIGGAIDCPPANAGAREKHRVAIGPMIAARVAVDLGRAAHLA